MAKNKDPAVLFYTRDFLADTTLWNYEDLGRYIKLLCLQHLQDGVSEEDFLTIAEGRKRVVEKFDLCEDGLYRNSRMTEETDKRRSFNKKQQANGSLGGRPKKTTENPNETQTKPKRNPNETPRVANENINTNISNNIEIRESEREEEKKREYKLSSFDERFNSFWSAYPKKVGKAYAKEVFIRMRPTAVLTQTMLDALAVQKKSVEWTKDDGAYIPNPSTWLNQGRWEDELTPSQNVPKYSNFDADEAFEKALKKSYSQIKES